MRAFFTGALADAGADAGMRRRIELLPDVVFEVDANGSLMFLGGASITMLGRQPGECLHLPLSELVAPEHRPALAEILRRDTPYPRKLRVRVLRRDGVETWVTVSLAPADSGGMVGTLHEIGAEKDAQVELADLKEEAAAAAAAKRVYIDNVSHEIRTPLAAIIGLSQLCLNTKPTDKQRDYLTKTEQAAQDLHRLFNDILDFSRMEAGGLKLDSGPFQLRNLLGHVDALMRPLARAKGLELQIERGEALPAVLTGDPTRLEQVIVNLVSNAIKFTGKGSVCVSALVQAQDAGRVTLEFRVSDTGIGLQPQQIGQIFEAHNQADNSTTRQFGGIGLGLAISKRLVERMGGSIWVTSTPGIGSTFYFTAQYTRAEAPPAPAAPIEPAIAPSGGRQRLRDARILVVEDNRFNQQIVMEFLEAAGAQVTIADNGARALQSLGGEPRFDVVLMDVQMPVMDGHEATRRIRANPSTSDIPVIALTANTLTADRLACSNSGMNDFEPKPIDPERLYATIARWLPNPQTEAGKRATTATSPAASAGIDRSALARLVNYDPVKIRRFALKFVENSRATLLEMQNTSKHSDLVALGRLAHRLKSSAATVGAEAFSTLCKELELACQKNDAVQAAQLVAELAPALEGVNAELLVDGGT
jgi:two-component system, sensor histidine kinase and response regulator